DMPVGDHMALALCGRVLPAEDRRVLAAFAAPAMAQQALTPTSLNGGLEAIAANGLKSDVLSSTTEGSPVKSVTDAATQLNQTGKGLPLVGGLPVNPLGG
ncbi:hypothetical protein ACFWGM_36885, partial [Streptomyces roseolus]|uniref:hypothetical protein n=1 Tax=Streptomyces roseolus TaxID=67358 RepID=UPI00364AAAD0